MEIIAIKKRKWKQKVSDRRQALKRKAVTGKYPGYGCKGVLDTGAYSEGLKAVNEKLQEEVRKLAGAEYRHGKENVRWGRQGGSVYLLDQKIPIEVPRVRNKLSNSEVPLEYYQNSKSLIIREQVFKKLLNGISTHRYRECAELAPETFGISASSLSRRFKSASATRLRQLQERSLERYDFVAILVDGKRFADDGIMIALGITIEGKR